MKIILFIVFWVLFPNLSFAVDIIGDIQQSHISSNLPDTFEDFQAILARDLKRYFVQRLNNDVEIRYELLRKEPTQSGVAYPKFYAWVYIKGNNETVDSGAVRLAAINKVKVEVTDFVSKEQIHDNPNILYSIFPRVLCENIRVKAH